jgi:DNA-binding IclR family transcriptional regulator
MKKKSARKRERLGIHSVEIASRILSAMTEAAQPLQLKDLARRCAMPASKVHRYLVSLTRTNLVAQESGDGRYTIGPAAIALGLAGLHSVDVVRIASEALVGLRDATAETTVLALWSDLGPVIIRIEESSRPVFMNVRVGSTLPVLRSAVGRIFAAYLPADDTRRLIEKDRRLLGRAGPGSEGAIDDLLAMTRRHGIGTVDSDLVPGVTALAAPLLDRRGRIVASIALLGSPEHLTASPTSETATLLNRTAKSISLRLGFSPFLEGRDTTEAPLESSHRVRKRALATPQRELARALKSRVSN